MGAIDDSGAVTPRGRLMSYFPVEPSLARMILAAQEFDCLDDILTVAAMLSSEEIWYSPRRKKGGSASAQRGWGPGSQRGGGRFDEQVQRATRARQRLSHPDGDHLSFIVVYNEWLRSGASMKWCLVRSDSWSVIPTLTHKHFYLMGIFAIDRFRTTLSTRVQ